MVKQISNAVKDADEHFESDRICNAFVIAAKSGFTNLVELMLTLNKNLIDLCDSNKNTALAWATIRGCSGTVAFLLDAGADVNKVEGDGNPPVYWAVYHKRHVILGQLLKAGADVDRTNAAGQTPLLCAVWRGDEKLVEQLLEANARVDIQTHLGRSPLLVAIRKRCVKIIERLLAADAEITLRVLSAAPPEFAKIFEQTQQKREWQRLINLAVHVHPLDLPVLVVYNIYKKIPRYREHMVPLHLAWTVLKSIKQQTH